jgi:predicted nucleotidyltransferase
LDSIAATVERFFRDGARGVAALWLFGSRARQQARPGSDVDLAVLYSAPQPRTLLGGPFLLQAELAGALGEEVDLVSLDAAPPDLVRRVLRDGRLLLDLDRSRRIAFEVRARNLWWDLEPTLRRYWGATGGST